MTKIQWTDSVWNPVTGCTKIATGCQHCYAERMSKRLAGRYGYPEKPDNFNVTLHPDRLNQPYKWRKPRMIFVCSMGDLFHEDVPDEFIEEVFWIMQHQAYEHRYQILTKRPRRMYEFISRAHGMPVSPPLHNVWIGTSVSTQADADKNIPWLLQTPAAVRFVSVEPMLENIEMTALLKDMPNRINWVICGAESGPGKRSFDEDWVRSARNQCVYAGVSFFYKQNSTTKMPALDGKVWDQMPVMVVNKRGTSRAQRWHKRLVSERETSPCRRTCCRACIRNKVLVSERETSPCRWTGYRVCMRYKVLVPERSGNDRGGDFKCISTVRVKRKL